MQEDDVRMIGPFRVVGHLGGGGFCEVLLGKDTRTASYGNLMAIKRLRPGLLQRDPVFLDSLLTEAEVGVMIRDSHVVRVEGIYDDGAEPALAMEYVDGFSLDRIIRSLKGRAAPPEFASEICRQLCEGLAAIHDARDGEGRPMRVIHQDIKPSNIMVSRDGTVKIIDLGVARPQNQAHPPLWVRQGTLGYRSPEQSRGDTALEPASDLFNIGVILYELLQAKPLFPKPERSPERMLERQRQMSLRMEIQASRIAPPGLDAILKKMLAFSPAERYSKAVDAIKELAYWQHAWNKNFSLYKYLREIEPSLVAVHALDLEPDEIHCRDTSPGARWEPDETASTVPEPGERIEELEDSEEDLPAGGVMQAISFSSFESSRALRRSEAGAGQRKSSAPRASTVGALGRSIFSRSASR